MRRIHPANAVSTHRSVRLPSPFVRLVHTARETSDNKQRQRQGCVGGGCVIHSFIRQTRS